MIFEIELATVDDVREIGELIALSVQGLQPEYTEAQRGSALQTIFTIDSRLIDDGSYFVARADGVLAGCGGWSYRSTLYGGDHQIESVDGGLLDPAVDAAKIRAIFVRPAYARMGLGSQLLERAEGAAYAAEFRRVEMGSTLAGVSLYTLKGYVRTGVVLVPVGDGLEIEVVKMEKTLQEEAHSNDRTSGLLCAR